MNRFVLGVALALVASASALAAADGSPISHSRISCVGVGSNAKLIAKIPNAKSARVYFRAVNGPEYYVEMLQRGGEFWSVLPIAGMNTPAISYRIVAKGEGDTKIETPLAQVVVRSACASFSLAQDEKRFAQNLVIGQTADNVAPLEGFDCYGVVSTVTVNGEMRAYTECDARGQVQSTATQSSSGRLAPSSVPDGGPNVAVVVYDGNTETVPVSPVLP